MINDKYRVNEVAKDLNVQMKDIVDLLEKNFPGEKKAHDRPDKRGAQLCV